MMNGIVIVGVFILSLTTTIGFPNSFNHEHPEDLIANAAQRMLKAFSIENDVHLVMGDKRSTNLGCQIKGTGLLNISLSSTWYQKELSSRGDFGRLQVVLLYKESDFPTQLFNIKLFKEESTGKDGCGSVEGWTAIKDNTTYLTSIEYTDLQAGNYCVKVMYQLRSYVICDNLTYYSVIESISEISSKVNQAIASFEGKVIYILLGILVSLAAVAILGYIWHQKQLQDKHHVTTSNSSIESISLLEAIESTPTVKVFLLYYPDCDCHIDVVHHLAKFLSSNNCEVSYDMLEKHEIVKNKVSWISNKLSGNNKIVLINSKMAYIKQQEWLQNKKNIEEYQTTELFLAALAIIMHHTDKSFDYNKVLMIRPSYVRRNEVLHDICPGKDYEIPKDLPMLLCHLHDLDIQHVSFNKSQFQWRKCISAYDELQHLISDIGEAGHVNCYHKGKYHCKGLQ